MCSLREKETEEEEAEGKCTRTLDMMSPETGLKTASSGSSGSALCYFLCCIYACYYISQKRDSSMHAISRALVVLVCFVAILFDSDL